MIRWLREHELAALLLAWAGLAAWIAVPALATLASPGLFYDEAWLAQQGRAFVEPTREGLMPPGAISTWLFGRPFPLFALPYLGSLKSQLLIPSLALFGTSLETLRATTLCWSLLALLASMFLAKRAFGLPVAVLTGALIATDPSFDFLAQREWGPFVLGLLLRSAGLGLLLAGRCGERRALWLLGAFALGVGVYNRADFVLILGSAALGLLLFHPQVVRDLLRNRRAALVAAAGALTLGALPILISAERVLRTLGTLTTRGDFAERWHTLQHVFDGSHFYRLMEVGGRFGALNDAAPALFGLFGAAFIAALCAILGDLVRSGPSRLGDGRGLLAVACIVLGAAMLALPGATRAHHMLNLMPFAQLLVAAVAVDLLRRAKGPAPRVAIALGLAAVLATNIALTQSTRSLLATTGGRGWWSDAILPLARELEAQPGAVAVSLDWGFHLPLLFLTSQPKVLEPIWKIPRARGGTWSHTGTAAHTYLVHDAPYDRFGFGPPFLSAVRALGEGATLRKHTDREGVAAFYSVRFDRAHRIRFAGGFRIELF